MPNSFVKAAIAFSIYLLSIQNSNAQTAAPQLGTAPVKNVVAAMTLQEKVRMLVGNGMNIPGLSNGTGVGATLDKVAGAAGTTYAIPRLGIPSIVLADGPAGVRIDSVRKDKPGKTYYATAFPVATLLASTWDVNLVNLVGKSFGNEVHEYGVDVLLAPALNIHRNPLGGRNFEYYSEDPYLSGKIAAAIVNGIQSNGVGTSVKHFVANNQETNRNTINTIVSERALREIYLRGFQIAVQEAKPWTVMSSYNYINGQYASESFDLLTTILRKEWGFKGLVMTDWFGGTDPVAQMKAGNDLLMPGTEQQTKTILTAVENGSLPVSVIDENVTRLLNLILLSPTQKKYAFSDAPNLVNHAAVSRQAAEEGMVLLQNNNGSLPLKGIKKLALFGNTSYNFIAGGTGSGDVNKAYVISLLQGLKNAGYVTDATLGSFYNREQAAYDKAHPKKTFFEEFMNPTPRADEFDATALIDAAVNNNDAVILTIGRNAGEGKDRAVINDFNLTANEVSLINNLSAACHAKAKKLIVVLNIGGVIETASWRNKADAILLAWQPGLEGGNAVANVLSGKVNPSGKLTTSFPLAYADVPASNFPGIEFPDKATGEGFMKRTPAEVKYTEGIFVGYRYYNTFNKEVAYPFGYGTSYTNFGYSNLKISSPKFGNSVQVSVRITNAGTVAGKEVVELYLHAPSASLAKPEEELKSFAKTKLLAPGASEIVTFTITPNHLASFNTARSAWVADAGTYELRIGASATDIRLKGNFTLASEKVVEKVTAVLKPTVTISELNK